MYGSVQVLHIQVWYHIQDVMRTVNRVATSTGCGVRDVGNAWTPSVRAVCYSQQVLTGCNHPRTYGRRGWPSTSRRLTLG